MMTLMTPSAAVGRSTTTHLSRQLNIIQLVEGISLELFEINPINVTALQSIIEYLLLYNQEYFLVLYPLKGYISLTLLFSYKTISTFS